MDSDTQMQACPQSNGQGVGEGSNDGTHGPGNDRLCAALAFGFQRSKAFTSEYLLGGACTSGNAPSSASRSHGA
eukprot:CAMPEP_0174297476 /NCGR_PEP_ID=MMETSP0809-20121228/51099_1 /TAXON_ID=73025 ORGANISM="Eutreptiella gymnastica-like, Strain CCMP1594" /NCGR_SAMPLE_ID=MMETSP0809 /ASSEMBLY_ACC=CAM_ASM_000658 /LENGTH=73 /DNA_ID=CAMNT_0015401277 /DNA_START=263 /DNA_END=484 /DNA_ORIENTATION=-